jgi:integrase
MLRERLHARDNNVLDVIRKGEKLSLEQWADFFLENYSKPPVRAEKTHQVNLRVAKHIKGAFGSRKLVEITADDIELYLRDRLRETVRVRTALGYRQMGVLKPTTVHQELRVLRRMLNVAVRKKLLQANPCWGVEFPVAVRGLFRPHYVTWSEQRRIESQAPPHLRNIVQIITETGLRVYKELTPMRKDQVDFVNATVWIPDSKTPNGIAEIPLTPLAIEAFKSQMRISGIGPFLFPSDNNPSGHQKNLKTAWRKTLKRAGVPYFRIYDLRSTYATRLSAGGVADEWVTQLLRQGDAKVFKKYSQMKLQMKREALEKMNRQANEMPLDSGTATIQ